MLSDCACEANRKVRGGWREAEGRVRSILWEEERTPGSDLSLAPPFLGDVSQVTLCFWASVWTSVSSFVRSEVGRVVMSLPLQWGSHSLGYGCPLPDAEAGPVQ